jgi:cytochrome c oxidase subunit II
VTAIAIVSAVVLAQNGDAGTNPLRVNVIGQQFAWRFEYPQQGGMRTGELVLPLGRSAKLDLQALDVIHSFWIPEMGQKQDAVPGIHTELVITPTRTGTFTVICTELCGLGHATMRTQARVLSQREFQRWVREQRGAAGGGGAGGGGQGEQIFAQAGCGGCHAFQPAGTDAEIGPSLDDLGGRGADFLRQSIVEPNADIAEGYQPNVMPDNYGESLSGEEIDALVQFLTRRG